MSDPAQSQAPPRPVVAAVSVALLRGRTVLLVERGRAPSLGLHAFPGGRVEPGESLEQAARRELMEETGLEAGPLSPVETIVIEPAAGDGDTVFELTVFSGPALAGEPVAASDAASAAFHTLDALDRLPLAGSVGAIAARLLGLD